jgi:cytochrome c peroxidase
MQIAKTPIAIAAVLVFAAACDQSDKQSSKDAPAPPAGASTQPGVSTLADDGLTPIGKLPLGLDEFELKIPQDNPPTPEKIALGKALFFDKRLSRDNTIACASCHDPQKGYSNGAAFATGVGGALGGRSAPTITNRVFSTTQFWDGRAASLEAQALGPIENPVEMDLKLADLVKKIDAIAGYKDLFAKAFGSSEISPDRIAKAIASFERTVVSGNSPFDRFEKGDKSALSPSAARGLELFRGKAKCSVCHTGFNLTDEKYHNVGTTYDTAHRTEPDLGRSKVSGKEEDKGAMKTPTLRDIALTAPYFADGSAKTLEEVVEYYDKGGFANPHLSQNMSKLGLSPQEKQDLVAIMKAFTGDTRVVSSPPPLPES